MIRNDFKRDVKKERYQKIINGILDNKDLYDFAAELDMSHYDLSKNYDIVNNTIEVLIERGIIDKSKFSPSLSHEALFIDLLDKKPELDMNILPERAKFAIGSTLSSYDEHVLVLDFIFLMEALNKYEDCVHLRGVGKKTMTSLIEAYESNYKNNQKYRPLIEEIDKYLESHVLLKFNRIQLLREIKCFKAYINFKRKLYKN